MTREDAVMEVHRRFNSRSKAIVHQVTKWTYEIYDDFESRTCENCHYYTGKVCYYHEGWNDEVGVVHPNMNKDDGCNRFENKEK